MRHYTIRVIWGAFLVLAWLPAAGGIAQETERVDFVRDIQPIFERHCVRCHGEEVAENMRMDNREEVLDYIEIEDAEGSLLYEHLISDDEDEKMPPPDEEDPLSEQEIQLVARWINEGAAWPEGLQLKDRFGEPVESAAVGMQPLPGSEQEANQAAGDADPPKPAIAPSSSEQEGAVEPPVEGAKDAKGDQGADSTGEDTQGGDSEPAKPAAGKDPDLVYWAIGSLHPAAVHLPIGLLVAAGLFGLLGIRGNFVMSDCAYYCLWLGTLGCIGACVTGWWFSPMEKVGTVAQLSDLWDSSHRVFWHRTSGLVVSLLSLILALFAASARSRDPDDGVLWKLGLVLLAVGISFVGHKGGELTHGKQHYRYLNEFVNSFFPKEAELPAKPPAKADVVQPPEGDGNGKGQEAESKAAESDADGDETRDD